MNFSAKSATKDEMENRAVALAQYPGAHCGLFEATLMAPLFQSSAALVMAPPSCLYHAKFLADRRGQTPSSKKDNLYLLNLKQSDVVFGVDMVIEEALQEIDELVQPEIIFLISTCVPEIIGFDEASLDSIKSRLKAKVLVVKTNGYSCLHQQKGRSEYLASLVQLMKPMEVKPLHVNILGLMAPNWHDAELVQVLKNADVAINAVLPGADHVSEIERAAQASLNIVIGRASLGLAEKMEQQFGTPSIFYDYSYGTEEIIQGYEKIAAHLGIDLTVEIQDLAEKHLRFLEEKKKLLTGISFAIGAVNGNNLEATVFYTKMGMEVKFLQTRMPVHKADSYLMELKQNGVELPIIHLNKTSRLEELIKQYQPQLFLGHGLTEQLEKANVSHCHPTTPISGPGFAAVEQELENVINLIHCRKGGA
mgnify:CR=1 FL=1